MFADTLHRRTERAPQSPPAPIHWMDALGRSRLAYVLVSLLMLVPCFWQPRVQAGDLSSHIYNSWLSQLIESGRADGLVIVSQSTNVLFDLILSGLFQLFGAEAAQRIAVSLAVLTFVWGAFAFVAIASGRRRPWHLMPCIAMLAYGWVFHMGFFNFYLSLGMCFWGLAMAWELRASRILAAIPVFLVAYTAHALPVVWALCLLAFLWLHSLILPRYRSYLTAAALLALLGFHAILASNLITRWSIQQIRMTTGADQVHLFDGKYYVVFIGLLIIWGALFLDVVRRSGARQVVLSMPFQFCVLSAAEVFLLPSMVLIPGFQHALVYIAERLSLGVAICVCALLGSARPRAFERYALVAMAVVFFAFLYRDERLLNSFEDRMQDVVTHLQPGQRVISRIDDPDMHVIAMAHVIDRVCIGHCYSYANYEPSTGQFRIRAVTENPFVLSNYLDSWRVQTGAYVVKEEDLPLLQVDIDKDGHLLIRRIDAGTPTGITVFKPLSSS